MTSEQLRIAVLNTLQRPRNHAPVIYAAIKMKKPASRAGSLDIGQMTSQVVTREL